MVSGRQESRPGPAESPGLGCVMVLVGLGSHLKALLGWGPLPSSPLVADTAQFFMGCGAKGNTFLLAGGQRHLPSLHLGLSEMTAFFMEVGMSISRKMRARREGVLGKHAPTLELCSAP